MTLTQLILRSTTYHWRTNVAVSLGVAAAVAVLGGALLVGDSVRGSLRDLVISRLGRTGHVVSSPGFFHEALAQDLIAHGVPSAAPLIAARGFVTHEPSGRRASNVLVYGVDERFWRFHGLEPRDGVFVSPALRAELDVQDGDVLLTRLQKPTDIPLESLFARKDDVGRTVRLTTAGSLPAAQLGEFSLQPQQAEVRAIFAPLRRLQRDLGVPNRVNTVLIADGMPDAVLKQALPVTLDDLGIKVTVVGDGTAVIVESASGVLSDALERATREAARGLASPPLPVFTYLANTIRVKDREVPYSLVSGISLPALPVFQRPPLNPRPSPADGKASPEAPTRLTSAQLGAPITRPVLSPDSIVLNDWAARDLNAGIGDAVELEFYLWDAAAGLRTDKARFTVAAIVPMSGLAADRRLVPDYPGITQAESLADWEPPFPIDLSRVRPQDEAYWREHRATPKAFIAYDRARDLWSTRYGQLTSLRFTVPAGQDSARLARMLETSLLERVSPASQGITMSPARTLAMEASAGATDFGEYFTYFSFFIVVSALMLVVLFFRLGIEQRLRQIGILRATGFTQPHLRWMFMVEAAALALAGGLVGVAGAIGYARAVVYGLKTWWVGAVGTTLLDFHMTPASLLIGFAAGVAASLLCVLLSLRAVARRSPRALLAAYSIEQAAGPDDRRSRRSARVGAALVVAAFAFLTLGFVTASAQVGAFFGAGAALLAAVLFFLSGWLRARDRRAIGGRGTWAVSRLGFRGAAFRPARSVLSAALVGAAAFIIVSVDAFRRGGGELTNDTQSGTGGYVLLAQSEVPIVHNPDTAAGREALLAQSPEFARASFSRFRMRPGDDVSCLNLYRPANPTIIAPEASFLDERRFTFAASLAATDQERANPWLLLRRRFDDGAVPVVADATSLQYVLHASVGDTMSIDIGTRAPLTLRFVGALRDSVLQGQLVMGEEEFLRLFPDHQGFRFFLIDAQDARTSDQAAALAEVVEKELQPFGVDAVSTTERLAAFHQVENTYLSTFQALGGLGLLLGTVGLATVMFRNVLERRRELALLRAVGYNGRHVTVMILAEAIFLLASGVLAGGVCAAIAIAPAWIGHGGTTPGVGLALFLAGVMLAGILSTAAATRAALSGRLLEALRAE